MTAGDLALVVTPICLVGLWWPRAAFLLACGVVSVVNIYEGLIAWGWLT